jgi:hypothetical protein
MRFNVDPIKDGQERAFRVITSKTVVEKDRVWDDHTKKWILKTNERPNKYYVNPKNVTSPAMLIQEQAWVNTTQNFTFDFSINGPGFVAGLNNIAITKNSVFCAYGLQVLFGTQSGAFGTAGAAASTIYRSHGVLPADDSVYNSVISMKIEQSTFIDKMEGQYFRDNPANSNEYFAEAGLQLLRPLRILTGELGVFEINIGIKNPIAALTLSANTYVSCRLHGVYGQAQG